jgi:hypothetical protein
MMSDNEWTESAHGSRYYIWTASGDLGPRIIETGSYDEMDARWPAVLAAFPDAWMTVNQHVSRWRVLKGVAK